MRAREENKTKTETRNENRTKEKITEIRKKNSRRKKKYLDLLTIMKTAGRLEPATFRFVGERVNHCATVSFVYRESAIIKFANGCMFTNRKFFQSKL